MLVCCMSPCDLCFIVFQRCVFDEEFVNRVNVQTLFVSCIFLRRIMKIVYKNIFDSMFCCCLYEILSREGFFLSMRIPFILSLQVLWKYYYRFDTRFLLDFQICVTSSTSGGLEQILPWMFYHKVIGVTNFFLFVEGKAASPEVSKVLQSIPVS